MTLSALSGLEAVLFLPEVAAYSGFVRHPSGKPDMHPSEEAAMSVPSGVRVVAVVPAAGQSVRMGQPKLLLPWGHHTVIEAVVTALRRGGVHQTLVIVGPKMDAIAQRAATAGALIYTLSDYTADMRKTVEQGLDYLRKQHLLQDQDGWLLTPADYPTLSPQVVRHLLTEFANDAQGDAGQLYSSTLEERISPRGLVLVPVYQGRRGHPLLLSARCIPLLPTLPEDCGINALLRHPAIQVREVPWNDPTILDDLDTPLDYVRLRGRSSEE